MNNLQKSNAQQSIQQVSGSDFDKVCDITEDLYLNNGKEVKKNIFKKLKEESRGKGFKGGVFKTIMCTLLGLKVCGLLKGFLKGFLAIIGGSFVCCMLGMGNVPVAPKDTVEEFATIQVVNTESETSAEATEALASTIESLKEEVEDLKAEVEDLEVEVGKKENTIKSLQKALQNSSKEN